MDDELMEQLRRLIEHLDNSGETEFMEKQMRPCFKIVNVGVVCYEKPKIVGVVQVLICTN